MRLEGRIHIFGLRLMREILCEVWQLCQRLRWACEVCGSDRITGEGYRDYGVMTVFRTSEAEATQGEVSRMHEFQSAS